MSPEGVFLALAYSIEFYHSIALFEKVFVTDRSVYALMNSYGKLVIVKVAFRKEEPVMKVDRRVLKTEQALESALLKLMHGKSIDQITTTELCREAGINRNTFYAHYPNPMSLLERIEDAFIKVIVEIIDDTVKDQGYSMLLQRVLEAILEHKTFSLILLSSNGDPNYLRRIIETAREPVLAYWRGLGTELSEEDLDILFAFLSNGTKQVILNWTENGFDKTPAELARKIGSLLENSVETFLPRTEI